MELFVLENYFEHFWSELIFTSLVGPRRQTGALKIQINKNRVNVSKALF